MEDNNDLNRYGIPFVQMLHDLTLLQMQRNDKLPVGDDLSLEDNLKVISCYYETFADMIEAYNEYCRTHEFP